MSRDPKLGRDLFVALDFRCTDHPTRRITRIGQYTGGEPGTRELWTTGADPWQATPAGQRRAVFTCGACPRRKVWTETTVRAMLATMWAADRRHVADVLF